MTAPTRDKSWNIRVPNNSDTLVREAATLSGRTKTDFVEESAVEKAKSVIAEHQRVALSADEFNRFAAELESAPVAIPALVELFSKPSQIPTS